MCLLTPIPKALPCQFLVHFEMVLTEAVKIDHNNVSYRPQSHSKAPVYTSDKRAKFTQRTNKKWVRLATVFGYIVSVSTPAIILSIYYIFIWHPHYIAMALNKTAGENGSEISSDFVDSRESRDLNSVLHRPDLLVPRSSPEIFQPCAAKTNLQSILSAKHQVSSADKATVITSNLSTEVLLNKKSDEKLPSTSKISAGNGTPDPA